MIKNPSKVLEPIVSILLAFLTGSLVIILSGEQPFEIFKMMFSGAFGSAVNISNTLVKTTTLTLAGLSYAFAYRCGLINIGAEGQMYIGALMATLVVLFMPGPGVLVVIVALIAGFLGGAVWGLLVGWLKVRFGANEVITTVMLNYVAMYLVQWAVCGPIQDPNSNGDGLRDRRRGLGAGAEGRGGKGAALAGKIHRHKAAHGRYFDGPVPRFLWRVPVENFSRA